MESLGLIQDLGLVMLVAAAAAWVCQRFGLPAVIGFIMAGVIISPNTHSLALIEDTGRIHAIAQVGLVFLAFSLGQGLPVQRLKRIAVPLLLGTVLIVLFVLTICRWAGYLLGWPAEYSLVLGAILTISSTAVLRKTLHDAKATNKEFGQTALTVARLDDLVAVIMLTLVTFVAQTRGADAFSLLGQVLRVNGVIVFLTIGSLLFVPAVVRRMHRHVSPEVVQLAIAGLLLALALASARAGFSAILGAFFLGSILGTTANRRLGEALDPIASLFGPVFFVAIGMLFDYSLILEAAPFILGVVVLGIVLRFIAVTGALIMIGRSPQEAFRAGGALIPVGEFSLILALAGVTAGLVPESFYTAAVCLCLVTALGSRFFLKISSSLGQSFTAGAPTAPGQLLALYHDWVETLRQRQNASLVWRLAAPRFVQTAILVLFVSGVLSFALPAYHSARKWLGEDWVVGQVLPWIMGLVFLVLVIAPLVAIWRQVEALAMICSEAVIKRRPGGSRLRPLFATLLRAVFLCGIGAWFAMLLPYEQLPAWTTLVLGAAVLLSAALFWRDLIRLQSRFEIELRTHLSASPHAADESSLPVQLQTNGNSELELAEVRIERCSNGATRAISELPLRPRFSCTLIRIERQGVMIHNPGPDCVLYPNDRILILGTNENLQAAEKWLNTPRPVNPSEPLSLAELSLGHLMVPQTFRQVGAPLRDLGIRSQFGIQIVRIRRSGRAILSPGPQETLARGDHLLVLGTPDQVSEMADWLAD